VKGQNSREGSRNASVKWTVRYGLCVLSLRSQSGLERGYGKVIRQIIDVVMVATITKVCEAKSAGKEIKFRFR